MKGRIDSEDYTSAIAINDGEVNLCVDEIFVESFDIISRLLKGPGGPVKWQADQMPAVADISIYARGPI